jgi:hypothetical protein
MPAGADLGASSPTSVAKGRELCAYRWDGGQKLDNHRFVWVPARRSSGPA